jgi:hypothetical protein
VRIHNQLVDCVVNRTLIPKILNIQIGKKAPVEYMSELRQKVNSHLADCLPSHFIPVDMISDETWNSHFKLFLEERAERIFDLIKHCTTDMAAEMAARYGSSAESSQVIEVPVRPRLKDLIAEGKVLVGSRT